MPSSTIPSLLQALYRLDRLANWEQRPRDDMRMDLAPMRDLMDRLDNPHVSFRAIHVAGTKGKGSVCALVEAGLLRAGYRVGRYASPHVECVTERISVFGRDVDQRVLADALTLTLDAYETACCEGTSASRASWFDLLTAAAFVIFRDSRLEWGMIEVGLGGRLDSTNVVNGEIAVVTNIELEHTEVLGGTRPDIAHEKIGILKPQSLLVTPLSSNDEAGAVLAARAAALKCAVLRPRIAAGADIETGNVAIAGAVLDQVGFRNGLRARTHPQEQVGAWLLDPPTCARARLPGRLEQRQTDGVRVVFDGAHVPFNLSAVLRDLHRTQEFLGPCAALVSLARDKDAEGFLGILAAQNIHAVFVDLPGSGRARPASDLEDIARRLGLSHEYVPGLVSAWRHGVGLSRARRGWLFVTGSLALVGALRGFSQPASLNSASRAAEHNSGSVLCSSERSNG